MRKGLGPRGSSGGGPGALRAVGASQGQSMAVSLAPRCPPDPHGGEGHKRQGPAHHCSGLWPPPASSPSLAWPTLLGDLCSPHSLWAETPVWMPGWKSSPLWLGRPLKGLVQPECQAPVGGPSVHRLVLGKFPVAGEMRGTGPAECGAWCPKLGSARWGSPASQVPERGKERPLSMESVKGMRPVS